MKTMDEGEAPHGAPRDRAGDAGAACGEQRPSSCTAARDEATRSRPDSSCTASDQATSHTAKSCNREPGQAYEEALCCCGRCSELGDPVAGEAVGKELAIALRELPSALPGHVPVAMSAGHWAEGLAAALAGSQAASFRDWMAGSQLAATRPSIEEVSDLDADTGAVLHTDKGKPRRCEREGEGCRGQRRAAHEGLRSVGDAAFSLSPGRGRAPSGSPRCTQSRYSQKEGQHSRMESGSVRLSQGSLVSLKGGHAECPDTRVRMSDVVVRNSAIC